MSSDPACLLQPGEIVGKKWKVLEELGKGSFGAVFKVSELKVGLLYNSELEQQYALKIESNKVSRDNNLLKVDKMVMDAINNNHSKHVAQLRAGGKNERFSWLVMTLLGPSLKTLQRDRPNKKFTSSTALRLLQTCFKAIRDVHTALFVHRDIKPDNFAIGHGKERASYVYIFDFGLARALTKKGAGTPSGYVRPERGRVGFRGTAKYASINAHEDKDLGRHDDLISALYMTVELVSGKLPWRDMEDGDDNPKVKECKQKMRLTLYKPYDNADLLLELQEELYSLEYRDEPKYVDYEKKLKKRIAEKGYQKIPLDWESPNSQRLEDK